VIQKNSNKKCSEL